MTYQNSTSTSEATPPLVSIVMPCLNEEASIGTCIDQIQQVLLKNDISGEIIVCDNGSIDHSVEIIKSKEVTLVYESKKGYGNAYLKAFEKARGKYIIMGDSDSTYDFKLIPRFLDELENSAKDFVTGSRYLKNNKSKIPIPFSHKYFGNPLFTKLLNILFGTHFTDVYCGLRGFRRSAYEKICPVSPGMEFNLELAINAGLAKLNTSEIPIQLSERKGKSKLRTLRDGWRSLRLILMYCPNKVYSLPGLFFFIIGILLHIISLTSDFNYHENISLKLFKSASASLLTIIGFEILYFGLHAKSYSWSQKFDKENPFLQKFYKYLNLEKGLCLGLIQLMSGSIILIKIMLQWIALHFNNPLYLEWFFLGFTLIILGVGTIFAALLISSISIRSEISQK